MLALLKRMGVDEDTTAHGLRSSFRDGAVEETDFDSQTIEFALSHIPGDKAEIVYRRLSAVRERRTPAELWESFLESG
jgi:integrase